MQEAKVSTEVTCESEEPGGSRDRILSGPAYAMQVDIEGYYASELVCFQPVV